jgi:hypothetical protein
MARKQNAVARRRDRGKTYYHGTSTEEAARAIMRHGLQPGQPSATGPMDPVPGKVYVTRDLAYAVIYGLGTNMVGHAVDPDMAERLTDKGRNPYGYVFIVPGVELRDIQPDEDSVGEMISKGEPSWLRALAEETLRGVYSPYPDDEDDEQRDLYRSILDGEYAAWAEGGKLVLDQLEDDEILALVDVAPHVAHHGPLTPTEVWRFDKVADAPMIAPDAHNFFDIATRVDGVQSVQALKANLVRL